MKNDVWFDYACMQVGKEMCLTCAKMTAFAAG